MSKQTNVVIYEKKKGASQVTYDSTVSSVLNESPYAYSISETVDDINIKYSTKRERSVYEEASDYILDSKEYREIIDTVLLHSFFKITELLTEKSIKISD